MVLWSVIGCLLLVAAAIVIARLPGAALGPYSTRLLGIAVVCAGYYGAVSWLRFGRPHALALRWHVMLYVVPGLAVLGALYCIWRALQSWRTEVHGFVKTLLQLVAVLVLGALGWLCLTH
ncbi:MAG: hypothetical protein ACREU2_07455 [Steroidobacteraceae bacterium]